MKILNKFLLLQLCILFSACQSINKSNAELGLPPSYAVFSFDDGPNAHEATTARLLDVLKKYGIKASFCLIGKNAEENPDLVRRIYEDGHTLINHGYSGKWAIEMKADEFRTNLVQGGAAISAALEKKNKINFYRPHGGFYNSRHEKICAQEGYNLAMVSVRVYDASMKERSRDKIIKRVLKKVKRQNGGVILLHDARDSHSLMEKKLHKKADSAYDRSWIPELVEELIIALREKGYELNASQDLFINIFEDE